MNMQFKDFFDVLEENLANCDEDLYFLRYGPDLFDMLCKILYEKPIDPDSRLKINAAIAYYVIPLDTISERFYGAYGYIDDVFLTVYVLRQIADDYGYPFLQRIWDGNEDIHSVMDECYEKSLEFLDDDLIDTILKYAGLLE